MWTEKKHCSEFYKQTAIIFRNQRCDTYEQQPIKANQYTVYE
jgi:hypothetical protein